MFSKCRASYFTVLPDDAAPGGIGSWAIYHSHWVLSAVFCAVSVHLKCRLLLLQTHMHIWPSTSTLWAFGRTRSQRHFGPIMSSFRLPCPRYHGNLFPEILLDLSCENQLGAWDYVDRLLIQDVNWHTPKSTWHWEKEGGDLLLQALFLSVFLITWRVTFTKNIVWCSESIFMLQICMDARHILSVT